MILITANNKYRHVLVQVTIGYQCKVEPRLSNSISSGNKESAKGSTFQQLISKLNEVGCLKSTYSHVQLL